MNDISIEKPVKAAVSEIPNLLQSLLVGLRIGGFDEIARDDRKAQIKEHLQDDSIQAFQSHFDALEGVSSSTWFALLYQIPAYLAEDIDSLQSILNDLRHAHPLKIIHEFPEKEEMISKYMPNDEFKRYCGFEGSVHDPWPEILAEYRDIAVEFYDDWFKEDWNKVSELLEKAGSRMTPMFRNHDWIAAWEEKTSIEFPYPWFIVELINPTTTQGTSLLADRDGFYAHVEPLMVVTMVSHEICTHLLYNTTAINHPEVGPLIEKNLERYLRANELVSWSLNEEVMQEMGYDWVMSDSFQWMGDVRDDVRKLVGDMEGVSAWEIIKEAYSLMQM
ncbi:MAG: hypothetical protein KGY80_06230 [Candidatus Thorarchaeota archaeon]|nr:hypothetical protein [Candidatus Thorarchaeota archaeon]